MREPVNSEALGRWLDTLRTFEGSWRDEYSGCSCASPRGFNELVLEVEKAWLDALHREAST